MNKLKRDVMMKRNQTFVLLCLGIIASSGSVYAASPLNDEVLAEQSSQSSVVTPEMVDAVKKDVQLPIDIQKKQHQKLAEEYSQERKQQNIRSVALSAHEEQKKTADASQSGKFVYNPVPVVRSASTDTSFNQFLFRGADVSGAKGDVSITVK